MLLELETQLKQNQYNFIVLSKKLLAFSMNAFSLDLTTESVIGYKTPPLRKCLRPRYGKGSYLIEAKS